MPRLSDIEPLNYTIYMYNILMYIVQCTLEILCQPKGTLHVSL